MVWTGTKGCRHRGEAGRMAGQVTEGKVQGRYRYCGEQVAGGRQQGIQTLWGKAGAGHIGAGKGAGSREGQVVRGTRSKGQRAGILTHLPPIPLPMLALLFVPLLGSEEFKVTIQKLDSIYSKIITNLYIFMSIIELLGVVINSKSSWIWVSMILI